MLTLTNKIYFNIKIENQSNNILKKFIYSISFKFKNHTNPAPFETISKINLQLLRKKKFDRDRGNITL